MSAFVGVYLIEGSRNLKEEQNNPDTTSDTINGHTQAPIPHPNSLATAHFHKCVKYRFVNL